MRKRSKILRGCLHFIYWAALVVSIFIGALIRVDPKSMEAKAPFFLGLFHAATITAPIMLPFAAILVAVSSTFLRILLPSPIEQAVKSLLDGFKRDFANSDDPDLVHRVTLFKHRNFCFGLIFQGVWPWNGVLIPFERSGEYRLKSNTMWIASKENPDKSEGVAGLIFKKRVCESIDNLPHIDREATFSTIERYAKDTNISKKYVEVRRNKGHIFPRSFWGVPIEVDGGKLWGVLLIDSRAEELPKTSDALKKLFRPYGSCLSKLLRGSKL